MATNTSQRREISYASLDEILEDAETHASQQSATNGNWSLGQILEHLATTMDKSIDGFEAHQPFFVRVIAKLFLKKKFLRDGFPAGFQLKGKSAEELVPDETTTEEGLSHLRRAIARLSSETKRAPHPAFGVMDADEWHKIHLRHAELHMSFVEA